MKRKVLLIIGKSDILIPGEYSFREENFVKSLRNRNDIASQGCFDIEKGNKKL